MKYGERLQLAMTKRGDVTGNEVTRASVARIAECSPQNIGMIINDAKNKDQKLQTKAHSAVAAFLRVNSQWLLDETGPMGVSTTVIAPSTLSESAIEMAVLYDMIPASDKIKRARAFNAATDAIISVLQSDDAK